MVTPMIAEPRVVSVRKRSLVVRWRTNQKRPTASTTNAAITRRSTTMLTVEVLPAAPVVEPIGSRT
jgi:hypothetical protein